MSNFIHCQQCIDFSHCNGRERCVLQEAYRGALEAEDTTTQDTQAERERFEAHFTDTWGAFYVARKENGEYWDELNEARWQGWQAARKSVADRPEPVASKPLCWLRTLNGEPDWSEDCIGPDKDVADCYDPEDGYAAIPLYAAPVDRPEPAQRETHFGRLYKDATYEGDLLRESLQFCLGHMAPPNPMHSDSAYARKHEAASKLANAPYSPSVQAPQEPAQPVAHEPTEAEKQAAERAAGRLLTANWTGCCPGEDRECEAPDFCKKYGCGRE